MAYRDYWNELVGQVKGLSPLLAQRFVNRAWEDIRDAKLWSWLVGDGYLIAPAPISAGTVMVAQYSTSVVGDAAAAAAWQAAGLGQPPFSGPAGTGRQFRLGSGPLYSIVEFDAVQTLTLDRPYLEASGTGVTYQIYRAYFSPPSTDFLRYLSLTNVQEGYTIRGEKLYMSQERLNQIDPQRSSTGDAYRVALYKADASGRPVHELWPHPVNETAYLASYQRRGADLSDTNDLPATIQPGLLMARAMQCACEWAAAQPQLAKAANWPLLVAERRLEFYGRPGQVGLLHKAMRQDDEIRPPEILGAGKRHDFPLDGAFIQAHDVGRMIE